MADMAKVTVPVGKVLAETSITVKISGRRRAVFRLVVSGMLLQLAAWINPCNVTIIKDYET